MDRHQRTSKRRQDIIEAALACITEMGYAETTLEQIRIRSKASTGSIYHHFRNKEHLAAMVYLEGTADFQAGFVEALEKCTKGREGVWTVVGYLLHWVSEHRDWARYLSEMRYAEFMGPMRKDFKEQNQTFFKRVTKWFRARVEEGSMRQLPLDLTISYLVGPTQEFIRQYLAGRTTTDLESAKESLAQTAWQSLKKGGD
ncbi:MAG: TetR/AcrR family transcriptional regulator [Myxococcota bacterium]|nr:TetR/AcrR family transcriptional regulator [Myxococcota bacterium]